MKINILEKLIWSELKSYFDIKINDIKINVSKLPDYDCSIFIPQYISDRKTLQKIFFLLKESKTREIMFKEIVLLKYFINIKLSKFGINLILDNTLSKFEKHFSKIVKINKKTSMFIEFGSINPVGFIHFGNLRNLLIGQTLSNFYSFLGFKVKNNYFVNDEGHQVNLLMSGLKTKINSKDLNQNLYYENSINWLFKKYKEDILSLSQAKNKKKIQSKVVKYFLNEHKETLNFFNLKIDNFFFQSKIKCLELLNFLKSSNKCMIKTNEKDKSICINWNQKIGDQIIVKSDGSFTYFFYDLCFYFKFYTKYHNSNFLVILGFDHQLYWKKIISFWNIIFQWNKIDGLVHQYVLFNNKKISKRKNSKKLVLKKLNPNYSKILLTYDNNKIINFNSIKEIELKLKFWKNSNILNQGKQVILLTKLFEYIEKVQNNKRIFLLYSYYFKLFSLLFLYKEKYYFVRQFLNIFSFLDHQNGDDDGNRTHV